MLCRVCERCTQCTVPRELLAPSVVAYLELSQCSTSIHEGHNGYIRGYVRPCVPSDHVLNDTRLSWGCSCKRPSFAKSKHCMDSGAKKVLPDCNTLPARVAAATCCSRARLLLHKSSVLP